MMSARVSVGIFLAMALLLLLAGCASTPSSNTPARYAPLQRAAAELPEDQLLDVWIEVFDPGQIRSGEAQDGAWEFREIREAEARFIPVHLRDTLQKTGYWGAVRVVPQGASGADVRVRGSLLQSDGERLVLRVTVSDASGRHWFSSVYQANAPLDNTPRRRRYQRQEMFQSVYNAIANDMARYRARLDRRDSRELRQIAQLRFAEDLSPEAFSDAIGRDESGRYRVLRLPAEDDPMYRRILAIRERELLLVDTLNGHFDNYYREMETPYRQWRSALKEERSALREAQSEASNRKLLGAAAIVGAIALEAFGGRDVRASTGSLRSLMLVGGGYALKTGFDMDEETLIHKDAIAELGDSFASEVTPLVVEVEGEVHELTGSAETQFRQWRDLLRQVYASETGLIDSAPEERP